MSESASKIATHKRSNAQDHWLNKADYEKVRNNIKKWPEWKRRISNTNRPEYAKPF